MCGLTACPKPRMVGKPPACPEWTDAEWLELKSLTESGDYPATVNRAKRNDRHCRALDEMR